VKKKHNILEVTAIVLANLCVSYIMTNRNEDAEELMKRIEKDEKQSQFQDAKQSYYHLCIVNLVIGITFYCFNPLSLSLPDLLELVRDSGLGLMCVFEA